jgi:hypothetical protein
MTDGVNHTAQLPPVKLNSRPIDAMSAKPVVIHTFPDLHSGLLFSGN